MYHLIGTAGWSIRTDQAAFFPSLGTHLQRYARTFRAVEINSSFYRPHRRLTYTRWAESTPPDFRFAVKLPKQITHQRRLVGVEPLVDKFLDEVSGLGEKLGVILVQLPPSLEFEADSAGQVFSQLAERGIARAACEPRHPSWFTAAANELLCHCHVARVAADPAIVPAASAPGGASELAYFRWHGSPRMYYSAYDESAVQQLADSMAAVGRHANDVWCIFDNTAEGAAAENARQLIAMQQGDGAQVPTTAGGSTLKLIAKPLVEQSSS